MGGAGRTEPRSYVGSVTVIAEMPQSGKEVEAGVLNDFPNFCVFFAEDCHQGKEEGYPFPLLEKKGVP